MASSTAPLEIDLSRLLVKDVSGSSILKAAKEGRRAMALMRNDAAVGRMDFMRLPQDKKLLSASLDLAKKYRPGLSDVIVCGIGGSALGFLALASALLHPRFNELPAARRKAPRYHVLDNADAESVAACLEIANLDKTLIVIISKSGNGGESIANFLIVLEELVKKRNGNLKRALKQVVAITDPEKGPLRQVVNEYEINSLPVPPNVGGRFSVLSPVAIFPAALMGMDVRSLLAGAAIMISRCGAADPAKNPAMHTAMILGEHYKAGRPITVMMPYANSLWRTADWFRQLWAESLGKAVDRDGKTLNLGMTPVAALGATDQHSQVQLYAEGPDDKTYFFVRTRSRIRSKIKIPKAPFAKDAYGFLANKSLDNLLNLEGDSTEAALSFFGRPTARITLVGTTPYALGQLLAYLEMTTVSMGALWNINTFNQPGVELGKILTRYTMGVHSEGEKLVDQQTGLQAKDILAKRI